MIVEEYRDGIAFYTDDSQYEIAFYSNITNNIIYNNSNGYRDWKSIDRSYLPYEDNKFIIDNIREYKRNLEVKL